MSSVLKVENINVYYGSIHAVKDVSFEVEQGEIVTLIGANGAGKSTTLNTVSGPAPQPHRLASPLWTRSPCGTCPAPQARGGGAGSGAGGTAGLPADDGGGEPGDGRLYPATPAIPHADLEMRLRPLPPAEGAPAAGGRAPCPAASSRCWPWAGR